MRSFLILIDRVVTRCGAVLLFVAASLCLQDTAGATAPLGPPPPKPKEVADHSLSIEAYAKLGIPALDLKWTEEDGAKAVSILVKLAKDDISKLPRYGSKFSGPVFEKLCQTEMRSVGSLLELYDDRTWQFDNECAEIRLAMFRSQSRHRRQLSNRLERLPENSKERSELKTRRDSSAVMDWIYFAQTVLYRTHYHWRVPARVRFYTGIEDSLRELISEMPVEFKSGRIDKESVFLIIKRDQMLDPDPKVKAAIKKLGAALTKGERERQP